MHTTLFLAQVWGPVLVAIGLGFYFSRKYYAKIYRDLEKAPFSVLFFGMFAMAAGIAHVLVHNIWGSGAELVVSILGWALLIKGFLCIAFPGLADRGGDWAFDTKFMYVSGSISFIIGVYLTWFGYFA